MATLFITCVLHCCTEVQAPDSRWDDHDKAALKTAQEHCYNEGKCLIRFKKVEESIYDATAEKRIIKWII
jgi:hypothetical protein